MSRFVLLLTLAACTTTINNNETVASPTATDSVEVTTDTDEVVPADTDTVDSDAPADTDVPDVLNISFTTALGPQGHVQLTPGQQDVNLGGFLLTVDGDEPVTVSQLPALTYVDTDGDGEFVPAPIVGDYFSDCRLILGNNPESIIGFSAGQADGDLSFFGSFQVQPGPKNGIIVNVYCDVNDGYQATGPVEISIDLPMLDRVGSDADPTELGYTYQPGNDNGGNFPSRSALMPWTDPRCTQQLWTVDGEYVMVEDVKPVAYIARVSGFNHYGAEYTVVVSDDGCGGTFAVENISTGITENSPNFDLAPTLPGTYIDATAQMFVNGQQIIGQGSDFVWGYIANYTDNGSHVTWNVGSPLAATGAVSNLFPAYGHTEIRVSVSGSTFDAAYTTLPVSMFNYESLRVSATVKIRDTRPGGRVWYISAADASAFLFY